MLYKFVLSVRSFIVWLGATRPGLPFCCLYPVVASLPGYPFSARRPSSYLCWLLFVDSFSYCLLHTSLPGCADAGAYVSELTAEICTGSILSCYHGNPWRSLELFCLFKTCQWHISQKNKIIKPTWNHNTCVTDVTCTSNWAHEAHTFLQQYYSIILLLILKWRNILDCSVTDQSLSNKHTIERLARLSTQ